MQEDRRSGQDRRKEYISIEDERRENERRALLNAPEKTIDRLRNISMFRGLTDDQLKKMVSVCSKKKYENREQIYKMGDEKRECVTLYVFLYCETHVMEKNIYISNYN